ncbi:MAG: hypothetical protein ACN6OP_08690 [Pseudomonadales bacterium]
MSAIKYWEEIDTRKLENGMFKWVITFNSTKGGETTSIDVIGVDTYTTDKAAYDAAEKKVEEKRRLRGE